jgi:hypothetical protein
MNWVEIRGDGPESKSSFSSKRESFDDDRLRFLSRFRWVRAFFASMAGLLLPAIARALVGLSCRCNRFRQMHMTQNLHAQVGTEVGRYVRSMGRQC